MQSEIQSHPDLYPPEASQHLDTLGTIQGLQSAANTSKVHQMLIEDTQKQADLYKSQQEQPGGTMENPEQKYIRLQSEQNPSAAEKTWLAAYTKNKTMVPQFNLNMGQNLLNGQPGGALDMAAENYFCHRSVASWRAQSGNGFLDYQSSLAASSKWYK